jgi:hypothetical protein
MFSVDGVSPVVMFQPAAWWKSSTWLLPLLIGALAALLLTTLAWPIAAAVRHHYGVTLSRTGSEARAYRLTRIVGIAVILILASWGATLMPIATNIFVFTPALDPWIRTLRVLSLLVFPGAAALALWNARLVWEGKGGRLYKVWSAVLSVACLSVVWLAAVFRLMGFSANY